jgi:nucleolar protein 14
LLYAVDPKRSADEVRLDAAVEAPDLGDQEYDKAVRELAFEQRAKPKDRTKTEEELALEEKQVLERAERKRQKRMRGEDPDSEGENVRRKRPKQIGGDDLEDDFYDEDGFGPGLREEGSDESDEDGEDDEGEGEDEEGEDGLEDDDDDVGGEEDEGGTESEAEGLGTAEEGDDAELVPKRKGKIGKPSADKELPYTFPCPESHQEFLDILEDIKDEDVPTVVHRIRTLHHPSLGEDNNSKLQVIHLGPPRSSPLG